jgi:hypothetical protein
VRNRPGVPSARAQTRWASSAARLYGRNEVSAEVWTWVHSPSFRATPLDLKGEAHEHLLNDINQLMGHGCAPRPSLRSYEQWDARSGRVLLAGAVSEGIEHTLHPYEATVVVLSEEPVTQVSADDQSKRRLPLGGRWQVALAMSALDGVRSGLFRIPTIMVSE